MAGLEQSEQFVSSLGASQFLAAHLSPGGTLENSPAFQRRVGIAAGYVPQGRLRGNSPNTLSRPCGTRVSSHGAPALKRRAIFGSPYRDRYSLRILQ